MIRHSILLVLFTFGLAYSIYQYFAKDAIKDKPEDYRKLYRKLQLYRIGLFVLCILQTLHHFLPQCSWL